MPSLEAADPSLAGILSLLYTLDPPLPALDALTKHCLASGWISNQELTSRLEWNVLERLGLIESGK